MFWFLSKFFHRSEGQDLAEYCLITALIALVALGIFWHVAGGSSALWGYSNNTLGTAATAAGNSSSSSAATGTAAPSNGNP